ncbi:DNA-binding protein [Mycoplasmatota bacterium WC44]
MLRKQIANNKYLFRLEAGEEVFQILKDLGKEFGTLCKISAIGACKNPKLGYLNGTEYEWKQFNGEFEITTFEGSISYMGDEVVPHIHVTISDRDFMAYGGHLATMIAYPMLELFVEVFDEKVEREFDENSRLNLIKF